MLKLTDVTLAYGKKVVLDHLNLTFRSGEIVGLVAPNGTGKSTLLNVILHDLRPQTGFVTYEGMRYRNEKETILLHQKICAFPDQSDLFPDMTGRDHLRLYADLWGNHRFSVESVVSRLRMTDYIDRKTKTYSLGMKQRRCFAMVVAADTPVMLLDEIMNGLDPQNVRLISAVLLQLKQEGKLLIMASHLLPNLQVYADRVLFLKDGKIVKDFDNNHDQDHYLKIVVKNDRVRELLVPYHDEIFENNLAVLPMTQLTDEALAKLTVALAKAHVPYTIDRIDVSEWFEKIYDTPKY